MCVSKIWTWLKDHAYPSGPKPWEKPFPEPPSDDDETLETTAERAEQVEGAKWVPQQW